MFGRKKKDPRRNLYYVFPVSSKAAKQKYFRLLFTGIGVGILFGGLMAGLFWMMAQP